MDCPPQWKRSSASIFTRNPAPYNHPTTTIHHVSIASQTIETTVTCDGATISRWVSDVSSVHRGKTVIVGLDVEWRPNFSRYTNNKAATLQLCVDTRCLIIQLIHLTAIPQSLRDFLSEMTFVGVEVANDVAKLNREYGLTCQNVKDLREAAGVGAGRSPRPGLKQLARQIVELEIEKPKKVTLSNWEARVLSEIQVKYACVDAYASYCIGHRLLLKD